MSNIPPAHRDYANTCANCLRITEDGTLEVVVDGDTVVYHDDCQISAPSVLVNSQVAEVLDPPVEEWDYGDAQSALRQTCQGQLFMDAPGGWAGQYKEMGSIDGFTTAANTANVCIPVDCKDVCDTSQPLKLAYRGCVEIVGTWTYSPNITVAKSLLVENLIQVLNPDGTVNCEIGGRECFDYLAGAADLQTARISNSYFIAGCVDCGDGLNILVRSQQGTLTGDNLFLDDAYYRMNMEFYLLRECV